MKMKITYIMDPQCGWCYGNSDNIIELYKRFNEDFDFELVVGGMLLGQNAPFGGVHFIHFLQNHTPRMVAVTGAYVDSNYYKRAKDSTYQFSSLEPSSAIQIVKELYPNKTFLFAREVQRALFVKGKRLDEVETYLEILENMSLDIPDFGKRWMGNDNIAKTKLDFTEAGKLTNGFPTLVITKENKTQTLASGYFDLEKMSKRLEQLK